MNYFLKTQRLGFAEWKEDFYPYALELWGNPLVSKFITLKDSFSEEDIRLRLKTEILNKQIYNIQYYPVFLLDGNIFIGCCGFRPYDMEAAIYEFGFYLKPEHWRKGYATEAAFQIIDYVSREVHIGNIYAGHHPDNISSKKALERLGFKYLKKEYYAPTGLYHPLYQRY